VPAGAVTKIDVAVFERTVAGLPPKVTVPLARLLPVTSTVVPAGPELGVSLEIVGADIADQYNQVLSLNQKLVVD
jgi:hypothetical protein